MARRAPFRLAGRVAAATLCAGCIPDERPFWVIDHTDALSLRYEVVARGPYAAEPPEEGAVVTEVMPGDRARAVPFVAGVEGPVDVGALRPRWFACGGGFCNNEPFDAGALPDCGALPLPPEETCSLGQGAPLEFEVGAIRDVMKALNVGAQIMMVSGTPEGPDTAECLRRFGRLEVEPAALQDCLFLVRGLRVGPAWRAVLVGALTGATTPIEPEALPWDVVSVEPDTAPEIERVIAWVPAPGGGEYYREVPLGGTLALEAGTEVRLSLVERRAAQTFKVAAVDQLSGDVTLSEVLETRTATWFSTSQSTFYLEGPLDYDVTWAAPEEPGEVFVYVVLADVRSADAGWIRVEVAGG